MFLQRPDIGWKEAVQIEGVALGLGERRALVK
jgi:hypothetical protein